MEDQTSQPTQAQLEQSLCQRVVGLYLTHLGHKPDCVSCQLLDQTLTIIIENPITQPERLLLEVGKQELAGKVRANLHKAVRVHLKNLIEEVLQVQVLDLLGGSSIETGLASIVAVLAAAPAIAKQRQNTDSDSDR